MAYRGPVELDPCASAQGWLPNGVYDAHPDGPAHANNYNNGNDAGLIFGLVWRLEDKRCKRHGTVRTELFIHSEMTPDRKQACGQREDQCWNGPSDYESAGCIKLSPKDIKTAARLAKAWGGPKPGQQHYRSLVIVTD